jgi:hypothetical protein
MSRDDVRVEWLDSAAARECGRAALYGRASR